MTKAAATTDTVIGLCRARPATVEQLFQVVDDLACMEDVSATVPGMLNLTEDKGLYYPSFTTNEATAYMAFMYHCRQTFTENTIRAVFAHAGISAGYMRTPNATGSKPFDRLSRRDGGVAATWQVGCGCL